MDDTRCPPDVGQLYPDRTVCPCVQVTAGEVLTAVNVFGAETVGDLKRLTGAGDGCTACHCVLKQYLIRKAAVSAAA